VLAAAKLGTEIIAIRTSELNAEHEGRADRIARLREGLVAGEGRHRMLICVDGSIAALSGAEWGQLPAESLLIDPIADPDAWRAAANLPGDRGLVLALTGAPGQPTEAREVLLWGLQYAASLGGRGGARVGFTERPGGGSSRGSSAPGAPVDTAAAERSLAALTDLLRLTTAGEATLRRELDPRSISPAAARRSERTKRESHGG